MKGTKIITAKYRSQCAETGKVINRGAQMLYNYGTRKCYDLSSSTATQWQERNNVGMNNQREAENIAAYVEAQENAYFDSFSNSAGSDPNYIY